MGEELQQARAQFHTENSMVSRPFLNNQLNDPFVSLDETSSIILKESSHPFGTVWSCDLCYRPANL